VANPNPDQKGLRLWKPGESGNPSGRPKSRSLTAILREVLDGTELCGQPVPGNRTVAQALIESLVANAIKGDSVIAREILLRIEGKPRDDDGISQLSDDELLGRVTASLGRDRPARATSGRCANVNLEL
jgi:hypothetical protein